MTTIRKRLARVISARRPLHVAFDAAKRAQLGDTLRRGDVLTHYHVRAPMPEWLIGTGDAADEVLATHFREVARQFPPHVVTVEQDLQALKVPQPNDKQ